MRHRLGHLPDCIAGGPVGKCFGVDISERMVELARSTAQKLSIVNARFDRMDAEDLHVADRQFDAALCALSLMYVPDPEAAVCELYRVLRPRGRAAAAVWGRRSHCGWAEVFPIVDSRSSPRSVLYFFVWEQATRCARPSCKQGFTDVVTDRIEARLRYESPEEACEATFVGGPVALAYDRFTEGTKSEVHGEYLTSIESFRDGAGYSIPGEFVIVAATKPEDH